VASSRTKKWDNNRKQLTFVVGSCVCFSSLGVHNSMSVESEIEKLQKIIKEKEAQMNEHR
jgi:hypothetical protein